MFTTTQFNYRNFTIASVIITLLACVILILSYSIGKEELFLLLNTDLGRVGDFLFNYATHAGDGLLWIVWLVAILKTKRKHLLPILIASFALSTVFTQVGKQLIYPGEPRPSEGIKRWALNLKEHDVIQSINGIAVETNRDVFRQLKPLKPGDEVVVAYVRDSKPDTTRFKLQNEMHLHIVDGVSLHSYGSFPSGHTATAFTFALLIALLIQSLPLTMLCIAAALVVAYTRIYLAQHYPLDIAAGMVVATLSMVLSIFIQRWFDKRRLHKHKPEW